MASPEAYIPQELAAQFRRQALRVWGWGVVAVSFWLFLILAAPLAKAAGLTSISHPLYSFFGYLCHQLPDRSFFVAGEPFGVCSRCFGVYFGLVLGYLIYPLFKELDAIEPVTKMWLFAACVPIAVDWSLGIFDIWNNTFFSRFATGTLLGTVCAIYIIPATVEIARNFVMKRLAYRAEL